MENNDQSIQSDIQPLLNSSRAYNMAGSSDSTVIDYTQQRLVLTYEQALKRTIGNNPSNRRLLALRADQ
jgi:hypothetical protein